MNVSLGIFHFKTRASKTAPIVFKKMETTYVKGEEKEAWDRVKFRHRDFYEQGRIEYIRDIETSLKLRNNANDI